MCRWLAYIGSPRRIERFVYDGAHSLCGQAQQSHKAKLGVHGDGGGLGWYGIDPQPGLYRNSGPAWVDANLRELTRMIESKIFFAHVRASTGAPNLDINCHPFRSGNMLFMHNGQIGGFPLLKRQLIGLLSDDCFDNLCGGTDSELLFQLLISNGLHDDPHASLRRTVQQVDALRHDAGITEAFRATLAVTNGHSIWALRWASDQYAPSLFVNRMNEGVLVVSEPLDEDISSWQKIPANSVLQLDLAADAVSINSFEGFLT